MYAFYRCSSLTAAVAIPASVTSVGDSAFSSTGITGLTFAEGSKLETIGENAFRDCSSLTAEVTIPASVTSIGNYAFLRTKITGLTFAEGSKLGTIGSSVFYNCSSLTGKITIPASVTNIGTSAFNGINSDAVIELLYDGASGVDNIASFNTANKVIVPNKKMHDKIITFNTNCEYAVVASGTCGTSTTWSLDGNGVLTIGGTGAMEDYSYADTKPWDTYKDQIKSIVIGEGITSIGNYAFDSCSSLTGKVTIPANVTSIGNSAFYSTGITGLEFADNSKLETIEVNAFRDCASLTATITIPGNVTSIGDSAFYSTGITGLEFADNSQLGTIGEYTFESCSSLTGKITIPASVTSIGDSAFLNTGITGLEFADNSKLETIGGYAFRNCSSLTGKITIPASVTSIGNYAISVTGITGLEFADNSKLGTIGNSAFAQCSSLTGTIMIPASVTSIGDSAFFYTEITELTFAEGSKLETIGAGTFNYCQDLTGTVTIPASVTSIGTDAFINIKNDAVIELLYDGASGVNNIASFNTTNKIIVPNKKMYDKIITFNTNCEYTVASGTCGTSTTWSLDGNGVMTIGGTGAMEDYSYADTKPWDTYKDQIKSIVIGEGITSIGNYAFDGCSSLTGKVTIPASVTAIKDYAFVSTGITGLTFAEGSKLETIGKYVFMDCGNLTGTVTIPQSVTSFGDKAFYSTGITGLEFADNSKLKTIGVDAFNSCSSLTGTIMIPASVTNIGDSAFNGCTDSALKIYVLNGEATIGSSAFNGTTQSTVYDKASNDETKDEGKVGGQVRIKTEDNDKQDLRMKYVFHNDIALPAGAVITEYGFEWSVEGRDGSKYLKAEKRIDGENTVASNIVITNIPVASYKTNITAKGVITFTLNGKTYKIADGSMTKNVYDVATAASAANDNKEAMDKIIAAADAN